jgi:hypothetical protein
MKTSLLRRHVCQLLKEQPETVLGHFAAQHAHDLNPLPPTWKYLAKDRIDAGTGEQRQGPSDVVASACGAAVLAV